MVAQAMDWGRSLLMIDEIESDPILQATKQYCEKVGGSVTVLGSVNVDKDGLFEYSTEFGRTSITPFELGGKDGLTLELVQEKLAEFAVPGAAEKVLSQRKQAEVDKARALAEAGQELADIQADPVFKAAVEYFKQTGEGTRLASKDLSEEWYIGIYANAEGLTKNVQEFEWGESNIPVEAKDILETGLTASQMRNQLSEFAKPGAADRVLEKRRAKKQAIVDAGKTLEVIQSHPKFTAKVVELAKSEQKIDLTEDLGLPFDLVMDGRGLRKETFDHSRRATGADLHEAGLSMEQILDKLS